MDAKPLLGDVARRMREVALEAVLIGNAAAGANRPRDRAVLELLERALEEKRQNRRP
jgi:hypothetical protein